MVNKNKVSEAWSISIIGYKGGKHLTQLSPLEETRNSSPFTETYPISGRLCVSHVPHTVEGVQCNILIKNRPLAQTFTESPWCNLLDYKVAFTEYTSKALHNWKFV
jgi:hypothetical protein